MAIRDHGDPGDAPSMAPPLTGTGGNPRTAVGGRGGPHARGVDEHGDAGEPDADGDPWASLVTYGLLGGAPVLCVSHMAEHGRNLAGDPRASIAIVAPVARRRPTGHRAGHARRRRRATRRTRRHEAARQAHLDAVPAARYYIDYSDFSLWVLRVRARALGRRLRADGLGNGRRHTPPPRPTRSVLPPPVPSPTSTRTTPTPCSQWPGRSAAIPDATVGALHRRRPLRPRPARRHPARRRLHPDRIPRPAEFGGPDAGCHSRIG